MSDVFISYSRKDKEFVQALHAALEAEEREIWIDWEDIPATADWWQEIERGIEGTSTFVFVISPDSIVSEVCNQEIDHAVKHHKRLVPIVRREGFEIAKTHPLSRHNWLFFRQEDNFDRGFAKLMTAIKMDLEYVRSHTRLLERAIEWDKKDRNESFLLRGDDLKDAEAWLMGGDRKEPKPTELQREYIGASQTAEEKAQILFVAGRKAKRMVQIGSGVLALTLIGAVAAGGLAWKATGNAREVEENAQKTKEKARQTEQQAAQMVATADQRAMQANAQVKAAEAKQKAAEVGVQQAKQAVDRAKAEQSRVQVESVQQIREAQATVAQATQKVQAAGQQTQMARQQAASAEERRQAADKAVEVAKVKLKDAESLRAEAEAGTQLERAGLLALKDVEADQRSSMIGGGLLSAMRAGFDLKLWVKDKPLEKYPAVSPILALQSSLVGLYPPEIELQGYQGRVSSVEFSLDGMQIATGGEDGTARIWDRTGKQIAELKGHQGRVFVVFSPNGTRIATSDGDDSARIWDSIGKQIAELKRLS
jgi:hypothetical protein